MNTSPGKNRPLSNASEAAAEEGRIRKQVSARAKKRTPSKKNALPAAGRGGRPRNAGVVLPILGGAAAGG